MPTGTLDITHNSKKSVQALHLPHRLLANAGPSNCSPRVLQAMSMQTMGCVDKELLKIIRDIKKLLGYVLQTNNDTTLLQQTSGTGGMETIISNLLDPGDKILVAVSGVWGERLAEMAKRFKFDVATIKVELGKVFTLEELEDAVRKEKPKLLFVTHGESSHGTLQPLEGIGQMCHKYDCLLAVDCVVSIVSCPVFTDRWEIDAVVGASQKALSAPPGMCMLTFSERARAAMRAKKQPPPFYYDVEQLGVYWGFNDIPQRYYYTYSSNLLAAIKEALVQVADEGLENVWKRHQTITEYFIKGCQAIGLEPIIKDSKIRLPAVSTLALPDDVKWPNLLDYLMNTYNMDMSFGVGITIGNNLRIGVMGYNARTEVADFILQALQDGMEYCRKNKDVKVQGYDHLNSVELIGDKK